MRAFVKKLNYSFDEENHIWLKGNQKGIAHNRQNKIEKRLARIIKRASDLSLFSSELRNLQKDWMATYHLSAVRSNVMRPFQKIFPNKDVLEVGSGCGAITRYLGECGANVLAIEENFHKATITRSRTRDLTNVTVLSEQFSIFQNIIVDKKFDVITLVGAYQHLNLFGSEESPMLALLEHSYKLLKPEGKLIIAIENPLGLKYFAGAAENEVVSPLYGTQANFNDNKVKALSRVTFSNILQKIQSKNVKFLLPFPDYKLPNSILTEEGIKNTNFDPTPFAYQNVTHDRPRPQYPNFNQELVWNEIVKNGLLLELANSFLVVASPNSNQLIDTSILAYHYTMHRATKYNKETLFKQTKNNGKITVLYKKMLPYVETTIQSKKPILNFDVPNSDQYILGRLFSLSLLEIITKKDWTFDQIASFFSHYLQLIQNFAQSEGLNIDITSLYTTLPGHFFDIIPHNIIVTKDGKPYVIDQEWSFNQPMELGYLLLRVFFSVFSSTFCAPKHQSKITFQEFVDGTLSLLGLKFKRKDYVRYVILENKIRKLVYDLKTDTSIILDNLLTHQLLTLSSGETLLMREHTINNLHNETSNLHDKISNLHGEISNQHNEINNLNHVIKEREHHISAIVSSKSWQVTKPLRFLSRLVRGKFSEAFRPLHDNIHTKRIMFVAIYCKVYISFLVSLQIFLKCKIFSKLNLPSNRSRKKPTKDNTLTIIATYLDSELRVEALLSIITNVKKHSNKIIVVNTIDNLSKKTAKRIQSQSEHIEIVHKKNTDFHDISSYIYVLKNKNDSSFQYFLLVNDSIHLIKNLDPFFDMVTNAHCKQNMHGILESSETGLHITSFFRLFDQSSKEFFLNYYQSTYKMIDKQISFLTKYKDATFRGYWIILFVYEVKFSKYLRTSALFSFRNDKRLDKRNLHFFNFDVFREYITQKEYPLFKLRQFSNMDDSRYKELFSNVCKRKLDKQY